MTKILFEKCNKLKEEVQFNNNSSTQKLLFYFSKKY